MFLLIDVDNTLYTFRDTGFDVEIQGLIINFIHESTGIPRENLNPPSWEYHMSHGVSLLDYFKSYGIDVKKFMNYLNKCSYHTLTPNKALAEMLNRMKVGKHVASQFNEKNQIEYGEDSTCFFSSDINSNNDKMSHSLYFFTNGSQLHLRKVLQCLGLKSVFTRRPRLGSSKLYCHSCKTDASVDDLEWVGFSYEDQWRLTEPDVANKPMRRIYEAVYQVLEEEVASCERQIGSRALDMNRLSLGIATLTTMEGSPGGKALNSEDSCIDRICSHRNQDQEYTDENMEKTPSYNRKPLLRPDRVVMVDDWIVNLKEPLLLGWKAVWCVSGDQNLPEEDPYQEAYRNGSLKIIHNILDLENVIEKWVHEEVEI